MKVRVLVAQSCPTLCVPWTVACQAPLSMEFSRQEYYSGLPFPTPGELPDPGVEPTSLASPALAVDFLPLEPPANHPVQNKYQQTNILHVQII